MISIIIPVYNKQKFIKSCVSSILKQSFNDYEILLINDGSTDNSGDICDELSKKDSRISVHHFENKGVSAVRNKGIELARGEYITFVDADDFLCENALQSLYEAILNNRSDIVIGGISYLYPHVTIYEKIEDNTYTLGDDNGLKAIINLLESSCGKLYRKEIISKNDIVFPVGIKSNEDAIFLNDYLIYSKRITIISKTVYEYNKLDTTTASTRFNNEFVKWSYETFKKEKALYEKWSNNEDCINKYVSIKAAHQLKMCFEEYSNLCDNEQNALKQIEKSIQLYNNYINYNDIDVINIFGVKCINSINSSNLYEIKKEYKNNAGFIKEISRFLCKPFIDILRKAKIKKIINSLDL